MLTAHELTLLSAVFKIFGLVMILVGAIFTAKAVIHANPREDNTREDYLETVRGQKPAKTVTKGPARTHSSRSSPRG